MSSTLNQMHLLPPGTEVWVDRTHGPVLGRLGWTIRRGNWGAVEHIRIDGKVVVAWDNGKTTAVPPAWLSTGAAVDPFVADIVESAFDALRHGERPALPRGAEFDRGWDAAIDAVRAELIAHGVLHEPGRVYRGVVADWIVDDVPGPPGRLRAAPATQPEPGEAR